MTQTMTPTTTTRTARANAFGGLLRSWRTARKTSQLALALDADVSQRHLSFLESGRAKPSREMVLTLAQTLDLPLRERNALMASAGFTAAYGESQLDEPAMTRVREALALSLSHHEPFPALVINREGRVVMANPATYRMLGLFIDLLSVWQRIGDGGAPDLMLLMLHPEGLRPYILNMDEVLPEVLCRQRREAACDVNGEAAMAQLEAMLSALQIPEAWRRTDWTREPSPMVGLTLGRDDLRLDLFSMIATFGTPQDVTMQELRLETFFPANEATRGLLVQAARE